MANFQNPTLYTVGFWKFLQFYNVLFDDKLILRLLENIDFAIT